VRRTYLAVGALALVAVLAIAGCGGGGSSSSSGGSTSTGSSSSESETASAETGGTAGRYGNESSETASETEPAGKEEAPAAGGGATEVAVVKVTNTPDLGKVVVDSQGMTMYDFHKDKGTTSSCYGACAEAWPPILTSGEPKAMGGAESSLLGTTKRKDGTLQVTYNGHPMYGFVEDKKPGETNGNDVDGFGAEWYALEPNGEEPEDG
jgi:predicted lipoprotein with Yx(FWY)xxD motif